MTRCREWVTYAHPCNTINISDDKETSNLSKGGRKPLRSLNRWSRARDTIHPFSNRIDRLIISKLSIITGNPFRNFFETRIEKERTKCGERKAQLIPGQGLFANGCKRKFESDNLVSGSLSIVETNVASMSKNRRERTPVYFLPTFQPISYAVTIIKIQLYRIVSFQAEIPLDIYRYI